MSHVYEVPLTVAAGDIVFIGTSPAIQEARDLALSLGYGHALVADTAACAVVDDDVLDGICTAREAALLVAVRDRAVPVLTAYEARARFRTAA